MKKISLLITALMVVACTGAHIDESSRTPRDGRATGMDDSSSPMAETNNTAQDRALDDATPQDQASDVLTRTEVLTRASIDIRGRRPSAAELNRLAVSPERLEEMIDGFLDDPGFADSVADLFSRTLRNRADVYRGLDEDSGSGSPTTYQQSVADESLMLLRHIVKNDLSYDEFLKADYTFANEDFAASWHMDDYDYDVGGWQRVRYGDGRPAAGYLSMSSVFMRFLNNDGNYNRGRANAMSRILLCADFLKMPVDFPRDLDLSDENVITNAISTNAACTSCHDQLDPIASFFSVYTEPELENGDIRAQYTPEAANDWMETTGKPPAFYGREGDDIGDLARFIIEDPRYARCAVTRVYEGLLDRAVTANDVQSITQHLEAFEDNGRRFKALYRSVMSDPLYRGIDHNRQSATTSKMLSPELLQRVITDITGFHPKAEGIDIMRASGEGESAGEAGGFRILAGGMSAFSGDYPSRTANVTRVLVQARLADAAALYVISNGGSKLEALVADIDASPGHSSVGRLFQVMIGRQPTEHEIQDFIELYQAIIDDGADNALAYASMISVLLRDPEFVMY